MNYEIPTCPICCDELKDHLSVTPCGHVFHHACILQSLDRREVCPLDRKEVMEGELVQMSFNVIERQDASVEQFFTEMNQEDQRSVAQIAEKSAKLLIKNSQLEKKLSVKEMEKNELIIQVDKMKEEVTVIQKELSRQKNLTSSLATRAEFKGYVADEAQKDCKIIEKEKQDVEKELAEMKNLKDISELLSSISNKADWAVQVRKSQSIEEQARLFYEAYRLQLSKENKLKDQNKVLNSDVESKRQRAYFLELDNKELKKRLEKLNKKLVAQQKQMEENTAQTEIEEFENAGNRKRKYNEFRQSGNASQSSQRAEETLLKPRISSDNVQFKKTEDDAPKAKTETQPIKTIIQQQGPRPNSLLSGLGTGAFGKNRLRAQGVPNMFQPQPNKLLPRVGLGMNQKKINFGQL